MSFRSYVTDAIKPLLPKGWKLLPYSTNLDVLSQPVVMLKLNSVTRTPGAPNGAHTVTYTLAVIEPKTDPGSADDALEDKLFDLLHAIDTVANLTWSNAERVLFGDSNPAFDISLQLVSRKDA